MSTPKEPITPNDVDLELFFTLADLKASGASWSEVSREVNRPVVELKRLTRQQAHVWDTCFYQAQKEVLNEAVSEAILAMRKALRSEKTHETIQATNSLVRLWDTLNPKKQPKPSLDETEIVTTEKDRKEKARLKRLPFGSSELLNIPVGFLALLLLTLLLPAAFARIAQNVTLSSPQEIGVVAVVPAAQTEDSTKVAFSLRKNKASPPASESLTCTQSSLPLAEREGYSEDNRHDQNTLFFRGISQNTLSG